LRQNSNVALKQHLKINVKKVKKTLDKMEKVCYNSHYIGYDDKGFKSLEVHSLYSYIKRLSK